MINRIKTLGLINFSTIKIPVLCSLAIYIKQGITQSNPNLNQATIRPKFQRQPMEHDRHVKTSFLIFSFRWNLTSPGKLPEKIQNASSIQETFRFRF